MIACIAIISFYHIFQMELDSMFNEEDILEDKNGKILRLFRIKENEVPVRDFTNNNLVPVPGKATASDAKKYMKWLAHLGFGKTKKGRQERSLIFVKYDKSKLSPVCLQVVNKKIKSKK